MQQLQQSGLATVELHPKEMGPNSLCVYHSRRGLVKLTELHIDRSDKGYERLAVVMK
jgi:hypothetical protein